MVARPSRGGRRFLMSSLHQVQGSCAPCVVSTLEDVLAFILTVVDMILGVFYFPYLCMRHVLLTAQRIWIGERNIKTVVVVGGNFGGLAAVHELEWEPAVRVILVDKREYFEYTPGVLRLLCEPALFSSMARLIPKGPHEFVLGSATSINSDHIMVTPAAGKALRIDFDFLILAVGADYRQPITAGPSEATLQQRAEAWQREASRVRAADSVLILGAGAVGAELAGEIACYYPRKRVTIVHGQDICVPQFPRATSQQVQGWLEERGVKVLGNVRVDRWDDRSCTTKDGRVLEADVVFPCFGMKVNSQGVSAGNLAESLGPRQEVRVNKFLQVEGQPNVYAVGDVMLHSSGELKQAYYAEMNGHAAAHNVQRHLAGKPLLSYPDDFVGASVSPLVYVVSLGRYSGSLGFNKIVVNGPIAALVKWFIEWTKVKQMEGRPIGKLVWVLGDAVTLFLSRTVVKPFAD